MPLTTAALAAELTNDPLGLGYAPLLVTADDAGVAAILNRKDRDGYVPSRECAGVLMARLKWGLVRWVVDSRTLPVEGSPAAPLSLYTLFATVYDSFHGPQQPGIRLEKSALVAGCDALIEAELLTEDDKAAILADEVKISRAEELFGYGVVVTPEQVGAAR